MQKTAAFAALLLLLPPLPAGAYIKYVEFNPTLPVLEQAYYYDVEAHEAGRESCFVELLAYAAANSGGVFSQRRSPYIDKAAEALRAGTPPEELARGLDYYAYYLEAYRAVLDGFVGSYRAEVWDEAAPGNKRVAEGYGLLRFSPIARGYGYSHYSDFGNARSFGYRRPHLGNDLMGSIGTPIVAVEGGVVEALGWNVYGGWRIGIRSFDGRRYYYYAHLRSRHPYHCSLDEGSIVNAGDVIGYLGMTGYSTKEGKNNINVPHLHFGLQLIFDESQKDGTNQIWVDVYNLVEFLERNRAAVWQTECGDFTRAYSFADRSAQNGASD